jgi:acyl-CoA thioester hydrolase
MEASVLPRASLIEIPLRVNGYDIDFQGVVHNIVYLRWFEDLRFELIQRHMSLGAQVKAGILPMLTSSHIQYKRPVRLLDHPVGRLWISQASKARWGVGIEIAVDEKLVAIGEQTGIFVDLKTLRPIRVPDAFISAAALAT